MNAHLAGLLVLAAIVAAIAGSLQSRRRITVEPNCLSLTSPRN